MGTDRTSAEIFLQGVGPLPDLIALDAHDPRDAAVKTGDDVPDLVDFADAGFNGFVRHRIEAKRRAQPVDRAHGQRNIRQAERSEGSRVVKEGGSTCRSRWSTNHYKKKQKRTPQ